MTFDEWLSEQEGFACRAERLYDDFPEVKDLGKLRKWLEAAYCVGYDTGWEDSKTSYEPWRY